MLVYTIPGMSGHVPVAIIGVGAIGKALLTGLFRAGWEPEDISLCVRRPEPAEELADQTHCEVFLDPVEAVQGRQVIVVSVKPRDVVPLLEILEGNLGSDKLVLSMAAGVTTSTYQKHLGEVPVIRSMPNTPALVGQSVTAIAAGAHAGLSELDLARDVLGAVGSVRIMDEALLDAVTAVSGTGPAYVFLLAEALTEAALREGLSRDIAERFVNQTILGAGHLLMATGTSPTELRSQVTSPGGTTAAAVHVLEERGFRALVEDAVRAAARRATELGSED